MTSAVSSAARVTVLMPCGDVHTGFFRETVASVLAQSMPTWRLIAVQSGPASPDTATVLAELKGARDPRVATAECASPGVTAALNAGMRAAQTPFVCVLHCDDLLHASAVAVLEAYLERYPEADYFHSSRIHIDEHGQPVSGLHGGDDHDFPWRMAEVGCRFQAIPECLYYYRDHRAHFRLTTHVPLEQQVTELVRIFRKHGLREDEIHVQIRQRRSGYLRQALFLDERDRQSKAREGLDIRTGWREPYE